VTVPELGSPTGVWLTTGSVQARIHALLLEMLKPRLPDTVLQESVVEELGRAVKRADVVLEYLGLRTTGLDAEGRVPLVLVQSRSGKDPWREALLVPGGECPIGVIVSTCDRGPLALTHEIFSQFSSPQQDLVRRYVALATEGAHHDQIIQELSKGPDGVRELAESMAGARRTLQLVDPSVLVSPDGRVRVQLGSLSDTTRNLLREGVEGEQVFILPSVLFEGRTNYSDVEFLVYLNFFVRARRRTRIVGTATQRRVLSRVLTLTVFGLFEPGAPPPTFEQLQATYGVPDRETYALMRAAHEMYALRQGPEPTSPILPIDGYVDFILLEGDETAVPVHPAGRDGSPWGEVRVRPHSQSGVEVRMVQADGRSTAKRLELTRRYRKVVAIPPAARRAIRFASDRPQFAVTVLGTSHGFDPAGDVTSFVVWLNGEGILVDPSPEALAYLEQIGVAEIDLPYVFLTHIHADHDGGLLEKLLSGTRTSVIAADAVFRSLVEKAKLLTGHDFEREGLVTPISANPGFPVTIDFEGEPAVLESRWNLHPIPANGFRISFRGKTFGYSGDTQYDPALLTRLRAEGKLTPRQHDDLMYFFWTPDGRPTVDLLYHEAGIPPIHTSREELGRLPDPVKKRTFLVHIADKDVPDGFVPGKPAVFETHTLLPASPSVRERALLATLRRVTYLYDVPLETLRELLRGGEVCEYGPGGMVIPKGPVERDQPLHFYVVADGMLAVQDGRRLITRLRKTDTFGEWGISHQRGLRVADVVAVDDAQCLRFSEAQYWWLVQRYPIIQERIGKIRSLLPRLEVARARAQQRPSGDLPTALSVIATMTTNQLAAVALFGEVRTFRWGESVLTEGDEADGLYILLSGHLGASVRGGMVGELGEGEIFGEIGLLEGGKRSATVTVVSADAEVLFMSRSSFERLVEAVPGFSWDIRKTALARRDNPPGGSVSRSITWGLAGDAPASLDAGQL
jgi:CRP-like cAMP-binding protein